MLSGFVKKKQTQKHNIKIEYAKIPGISGEKQIHS